MLNMGNCNVINPSSKEQRERDIVKRLLEKKAPAEMLESFIKRNNSEQWEEFKELKGDELIDKLTNKLIDNEVPEHKRYIHQGGRSLPTIIDFNRADLTVGERRDIRDDIKYEIVDKCLFDITGNSGQIHPLEKMNENVLRCRLNLMLKLAEKMRIPTPIKSVEELFHSADGEQMLQDLLYEIESRYDEKIHKDYKKDYYKLIYFDTLLLSIFENVIDFAPEYKDDGFIYLNKYVYKGPGSNIRKGFQDNKDEGFGDAFSNMANLTKMVTNFMPKYTIINGEEIRIGYIGEKNAVYLFAELYDFVTSIRSGVGFQALKYQKPKLYKAFVDSESNPAEADWSLIVDHYIRTRCFFSKLNIKECMLGFNKHVFKHGKGTWLYENFVNCIQKYRKTNYGVVSKIKKNNNPYLEFNDLETWTNQKANFELQDQIGYSVFAKHALYNTVEKRQEFAKKIGLNSTKGSNKFTLNIKGFDVKITIIKNGDNTSFTFEKNPSLSEEDILNFLISETGVNISKDALLYLQKEIRKPDDPAKTGDVIVKVNDRFEAAIAPIFGIWINSLFDKEIIIDGDNVFTPSLSFKNKKYGDTEIELYNYSDYFYHLSGMAEILQVVHNKTTSNVIKNIKSHNVPTTQLATIQQDGPILKSTTDNAFEKRRKINNDKFKLPSESKTKGFISPTQYNPILRQAGICVDQSKLAAGIGNGPLTKESKELKGGELTHWEIMYLFAQGFFNPSEKGNRFIHTQPTANADKNLQAVKSFNIDLPIEYIDEFGLVKTQNHTIHTMLDAAMKGDDSGVYEYYRLHNAQALLALENNICHSYNCAFKDEPGWIFTNNIEVLMSQLIKKRYEYLQLTKKQREGLFDWTLDSVKARFREVGLDFNNTTFGIEAEVKGSLYDDSFKSFKCVQFAKDMLLDFQIARTISYGDSSLLKKQADAYERYFIQDLIHENCDINTITDRYFKHLSENDKTGILKNWVAKTGDMILAKFVQNGNVVELTSYSDVNDIEAFKNAENIQINPILHAYHLFQFSVNVQTTEAYNGSRFSIGVKKDDGVYIKSLKDFEIITSNSEFDIPLKEGDLNGKEVYNATVQKLQKIKSDWWKNYQIVENLRMVDYYKRATVNGTREHRILYGGKYNIPEVVYNATFEDPEGLAILNSNESKICKAQDGSIWVMPWHALQIDAGAGEAKLPPGVRKTMYHDIDPITGGATLLKMAEYIITNECRRMSMADKMRMEELYMLLANREQITLNPNDFDIKIAINNLNAFFDGSIFYERQMYRKDKDDFGAYYAFQIQVDINDDGKLIFTKSKKRVNEDGSDIDSSFIKEDPIITNALYQIDRILGGAYSCDLTNEGLCYGEAQNKIVNKIICELNLKGNYIAYAVNQESCKNNIKNVNSAKEWFDVKETHYLDDIQNLDRKSNLWTSEMSTKFGGMILNALHEMDEDVDVARGVQMLSEMIQNGKQYGDVERIYNNVRLGIQEAMADYVDVLGDEGSSRIQNLLFDTIVNALANGKDKSKTTMAQEFILGMKAARDEKNSDLIGFPISDRALYDLLITTIVGRINREGIRARNSGFGGVKHPSFGVAQIFDIYVQTGKDKKGNPIIGKIYGKHADLLNHVIKFLNTEEGKVAKKKGWNAETLLEHAFIGDKINPLLEITKTSNFVIDLGETILYKDVNGKFVSYTIETDKDYQYFKRTIEPTITEFYRNFLVGRRLRGYRTECTYVDNETGNVKHDMMFNTDTRYLSSSLLYVRNLINGFKNVIEDELLCKEEFDSEGNLHRYDWENAWNFVQTVCNAELKESSERTETENDYLRLFAKYYKQITNLDFKEHTVKDLRDRVLFIMRFFKSEKFVQYIDNLKTLTLNNSEKERYDSILNLFNSVTTEDRLMVIWADPYEDKKLVKNFNTVFNNYLEKERLIGINKFTEEGIFEFTKTGETVQKTHKIKTSNICKAEYMKSKGNIMKQFLMGKKDSMFDILSKGPKYFEDKLRKVYAQPRINGLSYDVIIYDKARHPIFIKYDPNFKYSNHFAKNDEYFIVRNGLFKEQNGKVFYKGEEVCSSNKMSSWMKHGENGEKYLVLTIFDQNVFNSIVNGNYGKRDNLVDKVIPNMDNFTELDINIALELGDIDEHAYLEEYNNFHSSKLTLEKAKLQLDWLAYKNKRIEELQFKYRKYLVDNHIISKQWLQDTDPLDSWYRHEAKRMFNSFKKQLSAIGTRIPSQAMQSMMAMECVGYLDADYNEEMASIEMTYIQGSDYDIDKDYITEYFVDENGFVGDGTKLQAISAFEEFIDELPEPSGGANAGRVKYMNQAKPFERRDRVLMISYEDADELVKWLDEKEEFDSFRKRERFDLFKRILNAVNRGNTIEIAIKDDFDIEYLPSADFAGLKAYVNQHYGDTYVKLLESWVTMDNKTDRVWFNHLSAENIRDLSYLISEYKLKKKQHSDFIKTFPSYYSKLNRIAYYVNLHQTSIVTTKKDSQNMSLTKELQILSNPQNIASMEVSVDLSLDELKAFANERGVKSENGLSVWSAASKFKAQDTNLLGKGGVGVAANADKVYFSVYYYHTKVLNTIAKNSKILPSKDILKDISKVLVTNPFDESDIRCISKLNWGILNNVPNFNVENMLNNTDVNPFRRTMLEHLIKNASEYKKINTNQLEFKDLLEYLTKVSDENDGTVLLSALVSAATDNAKELVLSKLNAFGDILDAYGMCATLGIPFEETAAIFTSPLLNVCVKDIRGDIFDLSNFVNKLEGSFGMYFADFTKSKYTRINSRLSAPTISNFTKDLEGKPIDLNWELDVDSLVTKNKMIDRLIYKAKPFVDTYYKNEYLDEDFEDMAEDEYDSYDETSTQKVLSWEASKPIHKLAYISYLKRLKLRNSALIKELKIKSIEEVQNEITNIRNISDKLMPKLYEQQILHKMLGITKGIASKPHQLYRYIRELEYFVIKKYEDYNKTHKSNPIEPEFDFIKFFTNPEYAQKHLENYDIVREFTNILECLYTNEYVSEMLKTVGITNNLLTRVSFVFGNTQAVAKEVEKKLNLNRPLNEKEYSLVSRLVNEWTIYQFLTYHTDHLGIKINMSSARGEKKYTGTNFRNPIMLLDDETLSIDTMSDIETFKRLANLSLFPDLMEYYVTHKSKFSANKTIPSNMFIEAIITGGFTRTIPNIEATKFKPEITWKLAYNLNEDISDETSDYAQQMKRDFELIYDLPLRYKEVTVNSKNEEVVTWKDRGITIGDFIYLYNLIVYKNSGISSSFTKLFENSEELRKKSKILSSYNAFIAAMDSGFRTYDFTKERFFMDSVLLRLGAVKNSKLTDKVNDIRNEIHHTFVENTDYPFDFTIKINPINKTEDIAEFYDNMTKIITQNIVDKTDRTLPEPGIYYVQKSMLPVNPRYFLEGVSDNFVWVEDVNDIKWADLKTKYIIVTDPAVIKDIDERGLQIKAGYIQSELEYVNDSLNLIFGNDIVNLPKNSNFMVILENTFSPKVYTRPILLQDAIRKLWNETNLTQDGFAFNDYVKFVTSNDTENYTDHRKFAKAWFEYKNGKMQIYINLDACDNENVILHEIAHFLLIMNKMSKIDKYYEIANGLLTNSYKDVNKAWQEFKANYPNTLENGTKKLSDDLLFDEFVIDTVMNSAISNQNINELIKALREKLTKKDLASYQIRLRTMSIISQKIKDGELTLKCE